MARRQPWLLSHSQAPNAIQLNGKSNPMAHRRYTSAEEYEKITGPCRRAAASGRCDAVRRAERNSDDASSPQHCSIHKTHGQIQSVRRLSMSSMLYIQLAISHEESLPASDQSTMWNKAGPPRCVWYGNPSRIRDMPTRRCSDLRHVSSRNALHTQSTDDVTTLLDAGCRACTGRLVGRSVSE